MVSLNSFHEGGLFLIGLVGLFQGELTGLSGRAEPFKSYTGKFMLRTDPATHAAAVHAAAASGKSLNQFVVEAIKRGLGEMA